MTGGAGRHVHDLTEDGLGGPADLTAPATRAAGLDRATWLGPGPGASLARHEAGDLDLLFDATKGFLETDREVISEIGSTHASGSIAGREPTAEERVEDVREAKPLESRDACASYAGVTEHVIRPPPVGVVKDLVGLRRFLEPCLGFWVAGIAIRVKVHRKLAKGALQLFRRNTAGNPEDLVVVALNRQPDERPSPVPAGRPCR